MYTVNAHTIDGVEIPFDPSWHKIAVSVSGGADSAMLLYLLCNLITDNQAQTKIHVISHTRMWKTRPWQQWHSKNVFDYMVLTYPNITFIRHTNFIAPDVEYANMGPTIKDEYSKMVSGDNAQQRAFAEFICYNNNINAFFNGITRNPQVLDDQGMVERNIEPTADNKHLLIMKHMGKLACHPFRFTDKAWIVKQYQRLDVMELFDLTRSCERDISGIDYTNYQPGQAVPTCGKCFWCKERAWALEQNGL